MPLFFKLPIDSQAIEQAIAHIELKTSAELRVYIARNQKNKLSALEYAKQLFQQLQMDQTQAHNGVLIYIALKQRHCAVVGDKGIDQVVSQNFWQQICDEISLSCAQQKYTQGIVTAVYQIGEKLAEHYPIQAGDINELPNEVIIK